MSFGRVSAARPKRCWPLYLVATNPGLAAAVPSGGTQVPELVSHYEWGFL